MVPDRSPAGNPPQLTLSERHKTKTSASSRKSEREKQVPSPPGSGLTPQSAGSSALVTTCKHERVKENLAQTLLRAELAASLPSLLACCRDAAAPELSRSSLLCLPLLREGTACRTLPPSRRWSTCREVSLTLLLLPAKEGHQRWGCWVSQLPSQDLE